MQEKGVYTVSELTLCIKSILTSRPQLGDIWVRGEISNLTNHGSGHRYFTLKDKTSQIQCVLFRRYGQKLRFELKHGMRVLLLGDIDVYEQRGLYQLMVKSVRPDGIGEMYVAFEQLKNRLEEEGLFSDFRKKPLPRFPKKIGVVTSPTGAVFQDIINIVSRRFPVDIILAPTIVQGDFAAEGIVRSIGLLNQARVDFIIVARGGGSFEDLWAFNQESVARAIYSSRVPIISAVGHETDFTIADFVADLRAPTPSAAAELAVPDREEVFRRIEMFQSRLVDNIYRAMEIRHARLSNLGERVETGRFLDRVSGLQQRLDEMHSRICNRVVDRLRYARKIFEVHASKLNAISPLGILDRGYCIARKLPDRSIVRDVDNVAIGDGVEIVVRDGRIRCDVEDIRKEDLWKR